MFEVIICFLRGHKWHYYPEKATFHDYKVCDRCDKSVALSPHLTRGEIEWLDRRFMEILDPTLIRNSESKLKGEKNEIC